MLYRRYRYYKHTLRLSGEGFRGLFRKPDLTSPRTFNYHNINDFDSKISGTAFANFECREQAETAIKKIDLIVTRVQILYVIISALRQPS